MKIFTILWIIFANLVPLAGVLWLDWKLADVILLFLCETVVIFIAAILRIWWWRSTNNDPIKVNIHSCFTTLMYLILFGCVWMIQFVMITVILKLGNKDNLLQVVDEWLEVDGIFIAIFALTASHIFFLCLDCFGGGLLKKYPNKDRKFVETDVFISIFFRLAAIYLGIQFGAGFAESFPESAIAPMMLLVGLVLAKISFEVNDAYHDEEKLETAATKRTKSIIEYAQNKRSKLIVRKPINISSNAGKGRKK